MVEIDGNLVRYSVLCLLWSKYFWERLIAIRNTCIGVMIYPYLFAPLFDKYRPYLTIMQFFIICLW